MWTELYFISLNIVEWGLFGFISSLSARCIDILGIRHHSESKTTYEHPIQETRDPRPYHRSRSKVSEKLDLLDSILCVDSESVTSLSLSSQMFCWRKVHLKIKYKISIFKKMAFESKIQFVERMSTYSQCFHTFFCYGNCGRSLLPVDDCLIFSLWKKKVATSVLSIDCNKERSKQLIYKAKQDISNSNPIQNMLVIL